jgi:hypothetical protein
VLPRAPPSPTHPPSPEEARTRTLCRGLCAADIAFRSRDSMDHLGSASAPVRPSQVDRDLMLRVCFVRKECRRSFPLLLSRSLSQRHRRGKCLVSGCCIFMLDHKIMDRRRDLCQKKKLKHLALVSPWTAPLDERGRTWTGRWKKMGRETQFVANVEMSLHLQKLSNVVYVLQGTMQRSMSRRL